MLDADVRTDAEPIDPAGAEALEERENPASPLPNHTGVWADGQHGFAPYGQLFSRLRQSSDTR